MAEVDGKTIGNVLAAAGCQQVLRERFPNVLINDEGQADRETH